MTHLHKNAGFFRYNYPKSRPVVLNKQFTLEPVFKQRKTLGGIFL